jgi:hypothetical protein
MQAAIKPFIWKSSRWLGLKQRLSKNRPTLNQWMRLIAVGRSVGVKPSAPPAPMKAKCDYDSGDFTDDRRVSQRIREFHSFHMSVTEQSETCTKGK